MKEVISPRSMYFGEWELICRADAGEVADSFPIAMAIGWVNASINSNYTSRL